MRAWFSRGRSRYPQYARASAQAIGGRLDIASGKRGTTVRVTIPASELGILIADDHELIRNGIRGLLQTHSCRNVYGFCNSLGRFKTANQLNPHRDLSDSVPNVGTRALPQSYSLLLRQRRGPCLGCQGPRGASQMARPAGDRSP